MRRCGILLPVSSLSNKYGIGNFGKCAYDFIDFLSLAKQSYWQVLPLGPTSYGDSPYQSFCAFAGNPYFICLELLKIDGLLEDKDLEISKDDDKIDYEYLYKTRFKVLEKAYKSFTRNDEYDKFIFENNHWLNDYALFMSLKKHHNQVSWQEWGLKYKVYNKEVLKKYYQENRDDVDFWKFIQFEFYKQWNNLKNYAHQKGIQIIGDVPIYVALDSSDVWSNANLFQLDKDLKPKKVAGCPPDAFSKTGQLWGNPLYNYKEMEKDGYKWWIKRIASANKLYDVIRIDHFRGFEAYYSIPACSQTAENGKWQKGPGIKLFKKIKEQIKDVRIIAEDLGFLTEKVHELLKTCGFPGMKVLEFAFDLKSDSLYLPHNHIKNCVVYTGTHDNMPLRGWFEELTDGEKHFVREYLSLKDDNLICDQMVRVALSSVADLTIIPLQDYLGLGKDARINTPSTNMGNWTYRIKKEYISNELALYLAFLAKLYRRVEDFEFEEYENR